MRRSYQSGAYRTQANCRELKQAGVAARAVQDLTDNSASETLEIVTGYGERDNRTDPAGGQVEI